jgi:hypothetical protein
MTAVGASTADPLEDLVALVGRAESGLSGDTVRAVVLAAALSRAARTRLLKQLRRTRGC